MFTQIIAESSASSLGWPAAVAICAVCLMVAVVGWAMLKI